MKNLGSTDKKGPKSDAAPIPASKITDSNAGEGPPVNQSSAENDFFNKHYNKELRVSKDEIPIVLAELNESAIAFIKKEQFERALNLLQKAYGIMDAIDFNQCRRDMYHLFIMFHNMALCYQKMQMLEECAQCIEHAFEHLPVSMINIEEKSISNRMRKVFIIGKLKLQYCAILSQIHRHKDALDQAREGVKVCHQMINDMHHLCQFYVQREKINNAYKDNLEQQESQNMSSNQALDEYSSRFENKRNYGSTSRNRSFSSFLSQQEAYSGFESISLQNINQKGNAGTNQKNNGRQQSLNIGQNSQNLGGIGNMTRGSHQSLHSLSSFCTVNELEKSISYVERTAKKLLPILTEVKKRMIPDKKRKKRNQYEAGNLNSGKKSLDNDSSDLDDEMIVDLTKVKNKSLNKKGPQFDMKNILGYLNQGENLQTLSIGNIMQLQAFKLKDLVEEGKNELELTRESFIMKLSHMAVSYFCYSTEIRFILQMKEDPAFETNDKQKESEFWHAKALELACSFLPGECPLLNHINLSYQKHFAPVKTVIKEDEEEEDNLLVVKPLHGIENQKYHPIIKNMDDIQVSITPYQMTPLNAVTKPFINQLKSFNEYTESQKSQTNNNSFLNQNNSINQRMSHAKQGLGQNQQRSYNDRINRGLDGQILEGISEDGPNETIGAASNSDIQNSQQKSQNINEKDEDIKMLEKLFKKVQNTHNIDKVKLLKQLLDSNANGKQSKSNNKNILAGLVPKHGQNQRLEEVSQDQFSGGVDFLMDENILTNDSREEDENGRIVRTPNNNIKNQNVNSINQINSVVFNNQVGTKKGKSSKMVQSQKAGHHTSTLQNQSSSQIINSQPNQQSNHHQRPKTQINGQRNSSQREGKHNGGMSATGNQSQQHLQSMDQIQQKQNTSIQGNHQLTSKSGGTPSNVQKYAGPSQGTSQKLNSQIIDSKTKRSSQRPFSGGIQKMIKSDNHKSRVQNFNQKNFSMYDQKNGNQANNPINGSLSQMMPHSGTGNGKSQGLGSQSTAQIVTHSPSKFTNSSHLRARDGEQALYYNPQTSNSAQQLKAQGNLTGQTTNPSSSVQQRDNNQIALQKQIQQLQKQQQIASVSNVQMKNQLQGAANNIIANHQPIPGISQPENQQQYDDLKKRLLNEYKKMQKKGSERGAQQQIINPQNQIQNISQGSQGSKAGTQSSQSQLQNFIYQKNQIEQTLQTSAKALKGAQEPSSGKGTVAQSTEQNGQNSQNLNNNLNTSTNSAHLNVYKPTFIINNSFQPGQSNSNGTSGEAPPTHQETMPQNSRTSMKATQEGVGQQINNPNNMPVSSAGPHSSSGQRERSATGTNQQRVQNNGANSQQLQNNTHAQMSKSSQNLMHSKKSTSQIRNGANIASGSSGTGHGSQKYLPKGNYSTQQQQLLLMNVLMSQGLDKAQAMAQVQAQMSSVHQGGSKTHKESRATVSSQQLHGNPGSNIMKKPLSSGNRHHGSNRGVTPTHDSKNHAGLSGHHIGSQQQQMSGVGYLNQYQNQNQINSNSSEGRGPITQSKSSSQFQHQQYQQNHNLGQYQGNGGTLSAANLPQSSSVVTGGKMINSTSATRGSSQANQYQQHQSQINYPQMQNSRKK